MKQIGIPFIANYAESEDGETAKGVRVSVLWDIHGGNYKGVLIGGFGAGTGWNKHGDLEGICISGALSIIEGGVSGLSVGTLYNHAHYNKKIAIQIGTVNYIGEYDPNGTVIQIGLYNRAGEQTIPLINLRGLKNLFKKKKK